MQLCVHVHAYGLTVFTLRCFEDTLILLYLRYAFTIISTKGQHKQVFKYNFSA